MRRSKALTAAELTTAMPDVTRSRFTKKVFCTGCDRVVSERALSFDVALSRRAFEPS
jgi:hypothetical protein